MPTSITAIRMNGREMLFSTSRMMRNIAITDTAVTTAKSCPVVSIISFIHGASPISMPFSSYFLRTVLSLSICSFTSSLAALYSELISNSSHRSLSRMDFTLSGRISSGTREPTTDSSPKTYFTPSTFFISAIIFLTDFAGSLLSTRIM